MFDFERGRIRLIRGGKYPHCHSLFIDDRTRVMIDPSSHEETLIAVLQEGPVDVLVNSHAHEDHLIYNHHFRSSAFWIHEADSPAFEAVEKLIDCYGNFEETDRQEWVRFLLNECHYVPRKADRYLRDGEVIDLGEVQMEVVHTPGHTPGHLSFFFPREKVLFTGDLDLVKAGPYYGDVDSNIEDTIRSLKRLMTYPCDTYLTSHGKGIYEGDQRHIERYLESIFQREDSLLTLLRKAPCTLDDTTTRGSFTAPTRPWPGFGISASPSEP